jgi:hypothetical protein
MRALLRLAFAILSVLIAAWFFPDSAALPLLIVLLYVLLP